MTSEGSIRQECSGGRFARPCRVAASNRRAEEKRRQRDDPLHRKRGNLGSGRTQTSAPRRSSPIPLRHWWGGGAAQGEPRSEAVGIGFGWCEPWARFPEKSPRSGTLESNHFIDYANSQGDSDGTGDSDLGYSSTRRRSVWRNVAFRRWWEQRATMPRPGRGGRSSAARHGTVRKPSMLHQVEQGCQAPPPPRSPSATVRGTRSGKQRAASGCVPPCASAPSRTPRRRSRSTATRPNDNVPTEAGACRI